MARKLVFCLAVSRTQAEYVADGLKDAGFTAGEISVLIPERMVRPNPYGTPGYSGWAAGGMNFPGGLDWVGRTGWHVVPGPNPLLASGRIAAALLDSTDAEAGGGVAGVLAELGLPELEARRCERKVRNGHTLLAVHLGNPEAIARAKEIFEDAYAEDIGTAAESEADDV